MPLSRYFRFRLRTLLLLVFVASLPLAWAGYSLNWIRQRAKFMARRNRVADGLVMGQEPAAPAGLSAFGERGVFAITVEREELELASRLFPEAQIIVWSDW